MSTDSEVVELRFEPIIYVRGFAGTENEIEDTVADSYMGFNLDATKRRQDSGGVVRRHYFESPRYTESPPAGEARAQGQRSRVHRPAGLDPSQSGSEGEIGVRCVPAQLID